MMDFGAVISNLVEIGFYSVVLPFLLVYVVVYGILEKSGIFKGSSDQDRTQTKNINSIIAFVFALFVVASVQTVMYLQNLITIIVTFIIFILVVLILLGFIFGDKYMELFMKDGHLRTPIAWVISLVVLGIALIVLAKVTGAWDWIVEWWEDFESVDTLWTLGAVIGIGLILYWVSKDNGEGSSGSKK